MKRSQIDELSNFFKLLNKTLTSKTYLRETISPIERHGNFDRRIRAKVNEVLRKMKSEK